MCIYIYIYSFFYLLNNPHEQQGRSKYEGITTKLVQLSHGV